jgi:peptide/nickel transport system substrate-binding protein
MKKALIALGIVALSSSAGAQAFVYPAAWSAARPSDVNTGGTFRSSRVGEDSTINPFYSRVSGDIDQTIASTGLFQYDITKNEYIPYLAESYTLSPDKTVFTVKLRDGIKWSDGRPIVADDFITTANINTNPDFDTVNADSYELNEKPIKLVKVNNTTLRITLPSVSAQAFYRLAILDVQPAHIFGPVAQRGAAALKALWSLSTPPEQIVSSGEFKFAGYRAGERISYVKNPVFGEWNKDSAGKPLPYLDAMQVTIFRDQNAEFAAFLAGNLDAFSPRNAEDLANINRTVQAGQLKAVIRPNVSSAATGDRIAFNWNYKSSPFKQTLFRTAEFRRAMSHLANRAAMVQIALGGLGQPYYSMVYPVLSQFQSPELRKYDFNLEQATKLLASIGFTRKNSDGFLVDRQNRVLEFDLSPNAGNTRRAALAQVMSDEAKKVGVKINVRPVDVGTWSDILNSSGDDRKFEAIMYGIVGGDRILPYSNAIIGCEGSLTAWNKSGKCIQPWETQAQASLNRAERELDSAKRRQLIFNIQNIETSNQANLYLVAPNQHYSWSSRIRGELPQALQSSLNGSRFLEMSYIDQ